MKILGIETATAIGSVAIIDEKGLVGEINLNSGFTHSQVLLPALDQLLKITQTELSQIDCFAASMGPGSFTGLRIGLSTAKALAQGQKKPFIGVSTLEAMARAVMDPEYLISPMQNARRNQIYAGLYKWREESLFESYENRDMGKKERTYADLGPIFSQLEVVISPGAYSTEEWGELVSQAAIERGRKIALLGDGAVCYMKDLAESIKDMSFFVKPALGIPKALYVCQSAMNRYLKGDFDPLFDSDPAYIRGV